MIIILGFVVWSVVGSVPFTSGGPTGSMWQDLLCYSINGNSLAGAKYRSKPQGKLRG